MADAATPSQVNYTQTTIPDYAKPYVETMLGQAQSLTDLQANPYMQYQGARQAQFTPLQQQSYANMGTMQTSPQLQDATAMAGSAGLGALNTGYTYNPYQARSITGGNYGGNYATPDTSDPNFAGVGAMPSAQQAQEAQQARQAQQPQQAQQAQQGPQNTLQQYMNPYMQNVVQRQQQDATRQAAIASQAQGAQAARAGAFGGSGDYLMRGQAAGNLARQKGDIQAQGLNNAYQQAVQQFNAEQGQNLAAAQLNAQQGQFGAGLGLQGLQTANQAAQNLANIGNTQYNQNMGINQMQNQYGTQQQQQAQNILNNQYQDFQNYQNYPYKQLGFMSDMLRGLPLTQQASTVYSQPPSMVQQVAGLGLAGKGLGLYAQGGAVGSRPAGLAELAIYRMGQD